MLRGIIDVVWSRLSGRMPDRSLGVGSIFPVPSDDPVTK
jgi:hypothetical protein